MPTTEHTEAADHDGITQDSPLSVPDDLTPLWDAALPADAPGAWIRAAIERQSADA